MSMGSVVVASGGIGRNVHFEAVHAHTSARRDFDAHWIWMRPAVAVMLRLTCMKPSKSFSVAKEGNVIAYCFSPSSV